MTPLGTPIVRAPPPSSGRCRRGAPLAGGARLLTPEGAFDIGPWASLVVGRDQTCDIVIDDPLSSRRHAKIIASPDGMLLEDLKSTNGVYVNGARVEQRVRLCVGDRIIIGTTELSVFSPKSS